MLDQIDAPTALRTAHGLTLAPLMAIEVAGTCAQDGGAVEQVDDAGTLVCPVCGQRWRVAIILRVEVSS